MRKSGRATKEPELTAEVADWLKDSLPPSLKMEDLAKSDSVEISELAAQVIVFAAGTLSMCNEFHIWICGALSDEESKVGSRFVNRLMDVAKGKLCTASSPAQLGLLVSQDTLHAAFDVFRGAGLSNHEAALSTLDRASYSFLSFWRAKRTSMSSVG